MFLRETEEATVEGRLSVDGVIVETEATFVKGETALWGMVRYSGYL